MKEWKHCKRICLSHKCHALTAATVCTACACTKCLDETQWPETRDPRPDLLGRNRDILLRDRDETRDASVRDETETRR